MGSSHYLSKIYRSELICWASNGKKHLLAASNLDEIVFKLMTLKTIIVSCNHVTVTVKKQQHSKNQLDRGTAALPAPALKRRVIFH